MAWKILINDGMESSGVMALRTNGFVVSTDKIEQGDLGSRIHEYDGIIVRSATKVRKEIIDAGTSLKFIARGGVGLDNIDVEYARQKGIEIINTPAASSRSVAELALAHMFSLSRGLQDHAKNLNTAEDFQRLKKQYGNAAELSGKKILIIGLGRIGKELAKMCIGLDMEILVYDPFIDRASIQWNIQGQTIQANLHLCDLNEGLRQAHFISIHTPYIGKAILGKEEIACMQRGVYIINSSRGENIDDEAVLEGLASGQIAGLGLDVFRNEPQIRPELLNHPRISISPHIGASTLEAQLRIADELVDKIVALREGFINSK